MYSKIATSKTDFFHLVKIFKNGIGMQTVKRILKISISCVTFIFFILGNFSLFTIIFIFLEKLQ